MPKVPTPKGKVNVDESQQAGTSKITFTAEETARLRGHLPRFLQLKRGRGKKIVGFWEPVIEEHLTLSPLPPLTAEEIASGVDQGERRGERTRAVKHVSMQPR